MDLLRLTVAKLNNKAYEEEENISRSQWERKYNKKIPWGEEKGGHKTKQSEAK